MLTLRLGFVELFCVTRRQHPLATRCASRMYIAFQLRMLHLLGVMVANTYVVGHCHCLDLRFPKLLSRVLQEINPLGSSLQSTVCRLMDS
jgi:hypothetical protein